MWNKFLQLHQRGPDGRGHCKTIANSLRRRAIYQDFGKWFNLKVKIFGFFKEILVHYHKIWYVKVIGRSGDMMFKK